jgi:hypothetical protein
MLLFIVGLLTLAIYGISLSVEESIKKIWYLYTMAPYFGIQENDILFVEKWMELEDIICEIC